MIKEQILHHLYQNNSILLESLIKYYDINFVLDFLNQKIKTFKFKIHRNKIQCDFNNTITTDDYNKLKKYINFFSYYPTTYFRKNDFKPAIFDETSFINDLKGNNIYSVYFESKIENKELNNDDIPNVLYHTTPFENEHNILKKGLCPKTKNKAENHLDRIYLSKNEQNIRELLNNKSFTVNKKTKKPYEKFIIFKIDVSTFKSKIKFYVDNSFNINAVYTKSNIPPEYITVDKVLIYVEGKGYKIENI